MSKSGLTEDWDAVFVCCICPAGWWNRDEVVGKVHEYVHVLPVVEPVGITAGEALNEPTRDKHLKVELPSRQSTTKNQQVLNQRITYNSTNCLVTSTNGWCNNKYTGNYNTETLPTYHRGNLRSCRDRQAYEDDRRPILPAQPAVLSPHRNHHTQSSMPRPPPVFSVAAILAPG